METTSDRDGGMVRRFNLWRIIEHWVLILAFGVLVCTGLSQRFYWVELSQWVILWLGGIDDVRQIHRWAGVAFAVLATQHLCVAVVGVGLLKWRPTMLVTAKDVKDAAHNIRYYIGIEDRPARSERYDYKEKFMNWLVLTGALVMTTTGLALWFPMTVVRFMPGVMIPTAKALHSNEALLIFILIAIWHVYDSIFSPDVFPIDTSIFTGNISHKRMLTQHPLELERLEGSADTSDADESNDATEKAPNAKEPTG